MKMSARCAALLGLAAAVGAMNDCTSAEARSKYPERPVRIVLPLPPASSPDVRIRIIAEHLGKAWGQQVVVENRPGGGGVIAALAVTSASHDGYTLLAATGSTFTVLPAQKDKLPIDINRELIPIGLIASEGMVLAVSSKLGVDSLDGLIAIARQQPERIVIGTNPSGTLPHLAARLLVTQAKAPMTVVPYSTGGTNDAIRDILGGRVHAVIDSRPALAGALNSGDLKALAIMAGSRLTSLPELPTASELVPGLIAVGWSALCAPRGTPPDIILKIGQDLRKALEASDVRKRIEVIGSPFQPLFGADLARFIESEQKLWSPIVKEATSN